MAASREGAFQQDMIVTIVDIGTPAKGEPNDDKMLLKSCTTGCSKPLASPTEARPSHPLSEAEAISQRLQPKPARFFLSPRSHVASRGRLSAAEPALPPAPPSPPAEDRPPRFTPGSIGRKVSLDQQLLEMADAVASALPVAVYFQQLLVPKRDLASNGAGREARQAVLCRLPTLPAAHVGGGALAPPTPLAMSGAAGAGKTRYPSFILWRTKRRATRHPHAPPPHAPRPGAAAALRSLTASCRRLSTTRNEELEPHSGSSRDGRRFKSKIVSACEQ